MPVSRVIGRLLVAILFIGLQKPQSAGAQQADLRLIVPQRLIDTGLVRHLLPRFRFKTRIRVEAVAEVGEGEAGEGEAGEGEAGCSARSRAMAKPTMRIAACALEAVCLPRSSRSPSNATCTIRGRKRRQHGADGSHRSRGRFASTNALLRESGLPSSMSTCRSTTPASSCSRKSRVRS